MATLSFDQSNDANDPLSWVAQQRAKLKKVQTSKTAIATAQEREKQAAEEAAAAQDQIGVRTRSARQAAAEQLASVYGAAGGAPRGGGRAALMRDSGIKAATAIEGEKAAAEAAAREANAAASQAKMDVLAQETEVSDYLAEEAGALERQRQEALAELRGSVERMAVKNSTQYNSNARKTQAQILLMAEQQDDPYLKAFLLRAADNIMRKGVVQRRGNKGQIGYKAVDSNRLWAGALEDAQGAWEAVKPQVYGEYEASLAGSGVAQGTV